MKKLFTIIAVLFLSFTGVFVGCGESKYDGAKIEVASSALSGDVLTIGYDNSVEITAKTTGVDDINPAVNFSCSDTEALEITGVSNSSKGTNATIKAKKPTYGNNYFILKLISVETNAVYKELKVKVILPIEGIDFGGRKLAVSPSTPLRLFDYIQFYPQRPYVTNQKDVVYDITNYGLNNASSITIDEKTGLLTVSDDAVDNLATDADCLEVSVVSTANTAIRWTIPITVIRELKDDDITIESPQVSYNRELVANKKDLVLFTNSATYCEELVTVEVVSAQDIEVLPIKDGNTNIIDIKQEGNVTKTQVDPINWRNKVAFRVKSKSSADICSVKFRVKVLGVDNPLSFDFSDDVAINVKTSALPKLISLKQDAQAVDHLETISVYNEYVATETTSNHGTKIVPNVSSNSATSVLEENKYVKVEILSIDTGLDAMSQFILTDIRGNVIDTSEGSIEVLSNNGFYLKATDDAVGKVFKLAFTTQIKEFITYASGGSPAVEDELVVAEYYISANYGVKEITFEKDTYITKLYKPTSPHYTETIINFSVNENADVAGMVAEYDPTVLTVTKLDTFTYLIVGHKVSTTDFSVIAKNGFTKRVAVKVVDPKTTAYLSVDNPTTSQVITQASYSANRQLSSVSAKTGGRFNVYLSVAPSISGILKTTYTSSNETVATVSGSGVISTKNASGEEPITITVAIQYYKFMNGADGYATYVIETEELTFALTVFTPTRSITLSRNVATVYSYDSLGYDYKELSVVEVYAEISPITATIYGNDEAVSYNLLNNNGILKELAKGRYQATLPEGVDEAVVLIVVTVSEYGSSVSLVCTVTVKRAVQIEEIIIDNLEKANNGYYLLDMKEDERFTMELIFNPDKVFISDLYIQLYDEVDGELIPVTSGTIVSIDGRTVISKQTLDSSDPTNIYIKIYAKDSMYSPTEGDVFETIFVTIETGTLESPYLIENAQELQEIKNAPTKHYMLKSDIDLSGRAWQPIVDFSGSLNGIYYRKMGEDIFAENHKITGLTLTSTEDENAGLFANTTVTALLFNVELHVTSAIVSNNVNLKSAGALVGTNAGTILNCAVSLGNSFVVETSSSPSVAIGSIVGVGGMVGINTGFVYNFAPFAVNASGEFVRQYSAQEIEDMSIPDGYHEIVGAADSFLNIGFQYADGSLPSSDGSKALDMAEVALIIDALTSSNPVNGKLIVRDSNNCAVYAGGLVGYNQGYINGVYGLYNAQEESSGLASGTELENQFLISNAISATINSEGRDYSGSIGPDGATIKNTASAIGGVVGLTNSNVFNISAAGKVEGLNNVGGVIGKIDGTTSEVVVHTVSSSAKVTGFENVGGAFGAAVKGIITLVKVENYQLTTAGGDILINGINNVGGVIGSMMQTSLSFAYAVSFVEESTFTAGLTPANYTADIYNSGNTSDMSVGGVIGRMATSSRAEFVYSTMSIFTSKKDTGDNYAGGIAGTMVYDSATRIANAYYLGKFIQYPPGKTGSTVGRIAAYDGVTTPTVAENSIKFFFSTTYEPIVAKDEFNCFNVSDETVIRGVVTQSNLSKFVPNTSNSKNWELGTSLNIKNEIKFPVIKYESNVLDRDIYFIKQTPTAVYASVLTSPTDDRFLKLRDTAVLLTVSQNPENNEYKIKDLLKFTWEPSSIKTSSLRVTSSATNIVEVQEDGVLLVKAKGTTTLTFTSVLNLNASCTISVVVIPRVSEVVLYSDANLTDNLLRAGAELEIKKGGTQKVYPTFYDYDAAGKRVKIISDYFVEYTVDAAVEEFVTVNGMTNILTGLKETDDAKAIGFTPVIEVRFTLNGTDYETTKFYPFFKQPENGKKTFNVTVYTGATDLVISPNSGNEITAYSPQYLEIDLISDAKVDAVYLEIIDSNGNIVVKEGTGVRINGSAEIYDLIGPDSAGQKELDKINFMFDISYIETTFDMTGGNYHAQLCLKIDENKKYYQDIKSYTLRFTTKTNADIVKEIEVLVLPQPVLSIEDNYRVLEGKDVTSAGTDCYIFQEKPVDKIVPGKLGLISINIFPDYAGAEYYMIETTPEAMKYLNFAQLYKDTSVGASGISYIFGTNAEVLPNGNGLKLNRLSNYVKTEYTLSNGIVVDSVDEALEDSNNTLTVVKIEDIYDFDGNMYVELLTSNTIYELESFEVWITAVYADGSKTVYTREFETTYLPALTFETTRNYLALGTRENEDGSLTYDSVEVTAIVDGDYHVELERTIIKHGLAAGTEGVVFFNRFDDRKVRLTLDKNAQAGDKIRVIASYSISVEGRVETVASSIDILVVDAVIDDVKIEKSVDSKLMFTISSSQQLQAVIKGCAPENTLNKLSTILSRQLTPQNTIAYWKYVYQNGQVTNLDNRALSLPFAIDIKKVSVGDAEGLASISLVGSTVSGSANLMLRAYYYYNTDGELKFAEVIDESCLYPQLLEIPFIAQVIVDSTDDLPTPIYTESELLGMSQGGNYILMNDIEIKTPFTPISTAIAGLDGNNKIITISNFAYETSSEAIASSSLNLGLFSSVAENAVIKNVIVALPNDKESPMMLDKYTTINFGGIAGINNGIITNCEVISVYDKETYREYTAGATGDERKTNLYRHINYTFNVYTAVQVGGTAVKANIGGLVGINSSKGVITNSRVGRNYVEYVQIQEDDYNGTNPNLLIYEYTAPVTIMKLEGSGNIGGFVATNEGTISSSYFANGQLEISSYGSYYTQTGGFVSVNTGAVYSSYAAGWEEEDYLVSSSALGTGKTQLSINPETNDNYVVSLDLVNPNRKLGGGIYSNGNIGGFAYNNTGYIQDSYSNICLNGDYSFAANRRKIATNSTLTEYGNLNAGGFVFINGDEGSVQTSYSISKIKSNISTHGPFVGVSSASGDVQNGLGAEVEKCYYLIEKGEEIYNENDPAYDISQMSDESIGGETEEGESAEDSISIGNEFIIKDTFAGFAFDNNNYYDGMTSGAVWAMKTISAGSQSSEDSQNDYGYPELISANKVAISVRVLKPNTESTDGEADYSYIYALGYEKGSDINPQVITSASDYNKVFENILNVTVTFENVNVKYTGNMRLVNNIDFTTLTPASSSFEYTSPVNGKSVFDGNNLAISNVLLGDDSETNTAFGLFKVLNGVGVKNLTLTIRGVDSTNGVAVGALTGIAVESDINNINVAAAVAGAEVSGQNYVGGLAGIIVSGDDYNMHYINGISTNVSALASYNGITSQNIIKSGEIWDLIIPPARINKFSSDYNLRLQYLKKNVSYAGGIAGAIDLMQAFKSAGEDAPSESVDNVNARALRVSKLDIFTMDGVTLEEDNVISIEAEYAGGLFGFVGQETFIREATFEAYTESDQHYIMADIAAGGIAAVNYGFIDQAEVTYDEKTQKTLDDYMEAFVTGTASVTWGNQSFYTGAPKYLGGIVAINIGGELLNTGTIQNSYNRIDLVNPSATRIGGIAGASHIGAIVNAYTSANIVGDFTKEDSYFGAIVGQLFDNSEYNVISLAKDQEPPYYLEFTNITVATIWNPEYFEQYKLYTDTYGIETYETYKAGETNSDTKADGSNSSKYGQNTVEHQLKYQYNNRVLQSKGRIGTLYGAPTAADVEYASQDEFNHNPYAYYEFYVKPISGNNIILPTEIYKSFAETDNEKIDLFCGVQYFELPSEDWADTCDSPAIMNANEGKLFFFMRHVQGKEAHLMTKEEYQDLYTLEIGTTSNAKEKAFSTKYWSTRIWNFEETERLISLNFGYIPAIARIYTAQDFIDEIQDSPAAKKYYYIMNDIDFEEFAAHQIYVAANFRGTIVGVKQWNTAKDPSKARYPILYNIALSDETQPGSYNSENIALFHNTTNASFLNLNFVIKEWDEHFREEGEALRAQFTKRTSVLIANANTTTINNVNIGYRVEHFANGFLTEGNEGQSSIRIENMTDSDYALIDKGRSNFKGIQTYGTYFGGFIAEGLSSTIKSSSFNIPVQVIYQVELLQSQSELYAGGLAGKIIGTVSQSYMTRNFAVYSNADTNAVARNIYIGGSIGFVAGFVKDVGFGDPSENLSSTFITNWRNKLIGKAPLTDRGTFSVEPTAYIQSDLTTTGKILTPGYIYASNKTYIGGVIGRSTVIEDATATIESKIEALYNYNTIMYVKTKGMADVGGVIGGNDISAITMQYKYKELATRAMNINGDKNSTELNVGGIVGNNTSDYTMSQVYTNAKIYVYRKEGTSARIRVGGIVGKAESNFMLEGATNESYSMEIDVDRGIVNVGGIVGSSSASNTRLKLNYVISSTYIKFLDQTGTSTKEVRVGGLVGEMANNGITIYNAASLGNIYIDKSAAINSLYAGGIVGSAKIIDRNVENGDGAVVACNINYRNIGSAASFKIGQLAGRLEDASSLDTDKWNQAFGSIYFSENLFGLYTNEYYMNQSVNLNMEDLAVWFSSIFIKGSDTDLGVYLQTFTEGKVQIYPSTLTSLIVFNNTDKKFYGVAGSKLNPIELTSANINDVATKTYTYYKMSQDISRDSARTTAIAGDIRISSPISKLNTGNFIDARGHSIVVNSEVSDVSKNYVFTQIEAEAIVVGLLAEKLDISDASNDKAGLVSKNYGTLLGCGTATDEGKYIYGKNAAGLVYQNYGNIINCFSIASVKCATGDAAGLVFRNEGNIITSYFTGNVEHSSNSGNDVSGFVYANTGNITNSYTMSNIIDTTLAHSTSPLCMTNSGNLINVYYDRNAYTGTNTDYTSKRKNTADLSKLGAPDSDTTIAGNWFLSEQGEIPEIANLYIAAYKQDEDLVMKANWFNYSYSVANVNGNIPSIGGMRRFLNMLYTGNGKKENGGYTNEFYNEPFRITNAGMIESYFQTGNGQGVATEGESASTAYYILLNDISFGAYDEWSATWNTAHNANPIVFTGDFDGNDKLMYGIKSSKYGIFRLLGNGANIYDFTITDIKSQTGLIAGGMLPGAKINNVTIHSTTGATAVYKTCSVVNNNVTDLTALGESEATVFYNQTSLAGGLVGYQKGGFIKNITYTGSLTVSATDYAGGVVAIAEGDSEINLSGNHTADHNPYGTTTISVSASVAGGMIGLSKVSIKNYKLDNKTSVNGVYASGGFIGQVNSNGTLNFASLNNDGVVLDATVKFSGGIIGEIKNNSSGATITLTSCTNASTVKSAESSTAEDPVNEATRTDKDAAGGLVGRATYINLVNSINDGSVTIQATNYAGGLVGDCTGKITMENYTEGNINSGCTITATKSAAGGVVGRAVNGKIVGTAAKPIKNLASVIGKEDAGNIIGTVTTSANAQADEGNSCGLIISNVTADISKLSGENRIGGVIGHATAIVGTDVSSIKISAITVTGALISTGTDVGGVIGRANSYILISSITMNAPSINNSKTTSYVGGVVGMFNNAYVQLGQFNISSVGSSGDYSDITISGAGKFVGGVVGYTNNAKIDDTYLNVSLATTEGTAFVGGVVGQGKKVEITDTGIYVIKVVGRDKTSAGATTTTYVGGVAGYLEEEDKVITATVKFDGDSNYISGDNTGGVVGYGIKTKLQALTVTVAGGSDKQIYGETAGGIIGLGSDIEFIDSTFSVSANAVVSTNYDYYNYIGGIAGNISLKTAVVSATKFLTSAYVTGNNYSYAGGIFGKMTKGNITGQVSSGYTQNLVVNGVITGNYIGYLAGYIYNGDADNKVSISKITIPKASTSACANFDLVPKGSSARAGGIVGYIYSSVEFGTITELTNNRDYTFTSDKVTGSGVDYGNIFGYISTYSSAKVTMTVISNTGNITKDTSITEAKSLRIGGFFGYVDSYKSNPVTVNAADANKTNTQKGSITAISNNAVGGIAGGAYGLKLVNTTMEGAITNEVGNANVGGLVGYNYGYLEIVSLKTLTVKKGDISAATCDYVGGLVGRVDAELVISGKDSGARMSVEGTITGGKYTGGVIGQIETTSPVSVSHLNTSSMKLYSTSNVGGIVARIENGKENGISFTNIKVSSAELNGEATAGGIIGMAYSTQKISITNVEVPSTKFIISNDSLKHSGGVIGELYSASAKITTANVSSCKINSKETAGGIVGHVYSGSYVSASGLTSSSNEIVTPKYAGGIIGEIDRTTDSFAIYGTSSSNKVYGDAYSGGAVGKMYIGNIDVYGFGIDISSCEMKTSDGSAGAVVGYASAYARDDNYVNFDGTVVGASNKVYGSSVGAIGQSSSINIWKLNVANPISYASTNCYNIGGVVGYASSSWVEDSTVAASVSIYSHTSDNWPRIGGIVGASTDTKIDNCHMTGGQVCILARNTGYSYADYAARVGGIVGEATGFVYVIDCSNSAKVLSGRQAGGIVGFLTGASSGSEVKNCTNTGLIVSRNYDASNSDRAIYVGGIVGDSYSSYCTITTNSSKGNVRGYYVNTGYVKGSMLKRDSSSYADHWNNGLTESSYDAYGLGCYVGGILGYSESDDGLAVTDNYFGASEAHSYVGPDSSNFNPGKITYRYEKGGEVLWSWGKVTVWITYWSGWVVGDVSGGSCYRSSNRHGTLSDWTSMYGENGRSGSSVSEYSWEWEWGSGSDERQYGNHTVKAINKFF